MPAAPGEDVPVAVVGMAGRYPGAADLDAFWENLLAGRDCVTEIPDGRWDHGRYYDERRGVPGRTYSKWGGFLDGVDEFDPLFFGISPKAASTMDPQERLFLQCAWTALEDAGHTRASLRSASRARLPEDAGDVGVFVGAMYSEYQLYGAEQGVRGEPVVVPGSLASIANRLSYFLDASGPSVAVDTMCASALSAVHLACAAIRRGECASAVAGGVNLSLHPSKYLMIGEGQFASSDGRCRSFGADGDGYVPGEGVGAVLLRPLADAVADGDRVLGVIRGSAVNHGGHTHGFTVPNPLAQASVIRGAWRRSGVDPRDIGCIEAHGTGTALGDPVEIAGLNAAFGEFTSERTFCSLGSAKSNIGHLESAAGVAGLAKMLLQMRHGTLVPSLHAERTNPEIDFAATPFVLQREAAPWPRREGRPRLGGISAFGAGGSNAHLLVEEYVPTAAPPRRAAPGPVLAVLSARDGERLREYAGKLRDALRSGQWTDEDLPDIAYTLQVGREAMSARFAAEVSTLAGLVDALDACARGAALPPGSRLRTDGGRGGPVQDLADDEDFRETVVRWLRRGKLAPLAEAWTGGLDVDWARGHGTGEDRPRKVGLPGYPFARERYWWNDGLTEAGGEGADGLEDEGSAGGTAASGNGSGSRSARTDGTRPGELPPGDLTLHPVWEPVHAAGGGADTPFPQPADRVVAVGLAPEARAALEAYGTRVVTLPAPQDSGRSVADVRRELEAAGPFDHVVVECPTPAAQGARQRVEAQRASVRGLFRLLQALSALRADEPRTGLTLVTRDAFDPDRTGGADPAQAALHGLVGGLAKEQPYWRVRAVDLAEGEPFVPEEICALPADRRAHPLVRRGGQWLSRRLLPVGDVRPGTPNDGPRTAVDGTDAVPQAVSAPSVSVPTGGFRGDGVYVLIGGAGDLGTVLTEHLLRRYDARVVWVGRRAEDDAVRAAAARVAAATGGEAPVYLSADARDPGALARVRDEVLRRYGRIDGLVHLAMVFSHTLLAELPEEDLNATLAAKADPTEHFADVFAGQRLDFVLLVSSLVSFIRNSHQAHYAAACAYEDARAPGLGRALGCPVKVVNWGYWGNVSDEVLRGVTEMGLAPIEPASAMAAVEELLTGPLDQIGFMRLGRPLPVEGVLAGETLSGHPYAAVSRTAAEPAPVPVPAALAEHHAGPVPGEIDALLCRCVAATLRRAGLRRPA
ncbi:type I polyketide synthase, partial [Streptomyces nanshensis]|uniref:type I polyketide synthase n=1 Tax=Streptomyces nanshensis TaxID=518642 RepID=UPI000AC46D78